MIPEHWLYGFVTVTTASVQMDSWLHYDWSTTVRNAMTGSIRKYKGQKQKW
jgi:hypothetical protein